eukprot:CAMPEP_0180411244 /NCGR_PEP_ID=MMETSP0989-20121125/43867_1 /TAXON_ID=697907 /ORGANISM="non described non described, Strain CCMP2293" /LENGTH=65 /DNA_ID=CAMNT_0022415557 /DNA_START=99 /DNA_END=292 /DNA_ORIENTATION=-
MEHLSPGASLPEAPSSASRERELFAELDALKERLRVKSETAWASSSSSRQHIGAARDMFDALYAR